MVAAPGVAYRPLAEAVTCPIVLFHRQTDTSAELRTLHCVLAQFLYDRGHPVPADLQNGMLRLS
jgi:hypothetical protein